MGSALVSRHVRMSLFTCIPRLSPATIAFPTDTQLPETDSSVAGTTSWDRFPACGKWPRASFGGTARARMASGQRVACATAGPVCWGDVQHVRREPSSDSACFSTPVSAQRNRACGASPRRATSEVSVRLRVRVESGIASFAAASAAGALRPCAQPFCACCAGYCAPAISLGSRGAGSAAARARSERELLCLGVQPTCAWPTLGRFRLIRPVGSRARSCPVLWFASEPFFGVRLRGRVTLILHGRIARPP